MIPEKELNFNEWLDLQSEETFTEGPYEVKKPNPWKEENEEAGLK